MSSSGKRALVVGSTGIVGRSLGVMLAREGWTTFGLSRSGSVELPGVTSIQVDLLDPAALSEAVADVRPSFAAITAWMRRDTEAENIRVNSATVRNLLAALEPAKSLEHVALMTGLKHYLGPFEAYGKAVMAETPFHEAEPRLDYPNFYYAQEDELFASAARTGFGWSVHRSHTVLGFAVGNAMNMVLTLSVYATLCKELGRPFVFPGSQMQWNALTDVTDADLLSEQMIWAATHPEGRNQAFNTANGDVFRWRWLWPQLADFFGIPWEGFVENPRTLESQMVGMEETWREIAARYKLVEPDLGRLASWWHSDADLGRTIEVLTDMTKSRESGFLGFRSTPASFLAKIKQYRAARILP
jgi:nucleoside-diphosphate-sugar epimerase